MRNLEYKARIADLGWYQARALGLGAEAQGERRQRDTYFPVPEGRLKLREVVGSDVELIFCERDENGADRASDYEVFRTPAAAELRDLLTGALGVLAVVTKRRALLILDGARIHLDNVGGLGTFIELEVPVHQGDTSASDRLNRQLSALGLSWEQCIRASYLDLATEIKL